MTTVLNNTQLIIKFVKKTMVISNKNKLGLAKRYPVLLQTKKSPMLHGLGDQLMADNKFNVNEDELKQKLTPEQYHILRQGGTEAPGSSPLLHETAQGMYACAVCGQQLFSSDAKFDTNVPGLKGWPSFDQALPGSIELRPDDSYGMHRTEIICSRCGSHLGHLFDDPEAKSGKHYCINGACLLMKPSGETK